MKRFACVLFALFLVCALTIPTRATKDEMGSIEIRVNYEDTRITGGTLTAVRVGYVDYEYHVFREFVTDSKITGIGEPGTVTEYQNFYNAYKNAFQFDVFKTDIKNGIAEFKNVPQGLYLIYQQTPAPGFRALSDFLVTVPYEENLDVSIASKPELELEEETIPETSEPDPPDDEKLPQTGQLTWPIPLMGITGVVLFVHGWWLCFVRREDCE